MVNSQKLILKNKHKEKIMCEMHTEMFNDRKIIVIAFPASTLHSCVTHCQNLEVILNALNKKRSNAVIGKKVSIRTLFTRKQNRQRKIKT